jgi:hypothetical protein
MKPIPGDGRGMSLAEAITRRERMARVWGSLSNAVPTEVPPRQYDDGVHRHDRQWTWPRCLMPLDIETGAPSPHALHVTEYAFEDEGLEYCDADLNVDDVALDQGVIVAVCPRCREALAKAIRD